ncbi:MAG: hypothetical protein ACREU7_12840, partial [Burkholderiales bacterium]
MFLLRIAPPVLLLTACAGTEYRFQDLKITFEPYEDPVDARTAAKPSTPTPAAAFPEVSIPYQKHSLPNGLTLILHEDHKAPLVAV